MKPGTQKEKGNKFERDLSRKLSKWWTNGERDDLTWRTSNSGGMSTTRFKSGKNTTNQQGDIQAIDPLIQPFHDLFSIEAKRGYDSTNLLKHLDYKTNKEFEDFWKQTERDANSSNKQPMLILKRDYKEGVVFIYKSVYDKFVEFHGVPIIKTLILNYGNEARKKIIGMKLDDFLNWIGPECIRRLSCKENSN